MRASQHLEQKRLLATAAARSGEATTPSWARNVSPIAEPAHRRAAVLEAVRDQLHQRQDAFYVVDLAEVAHKYKEWCTQLPRARPFYAVKCNDDPHVVATLLKCGAGLDCASKGEMSLALKLGSKPEDIIFAHPAKQISHIRFAREKGVKKMTFDNEFELRKVAAEHPEAEMVLRILADDSASVCRLGLKFGAPLDRVPSLLQTAKSLGLKVIGISYHVGSGNGEAKAFGDAVRDARKAFDVAESMGMKMNFLDIGGGFPGSEMGVDLDLEEKKRALAASSLSASSTDPYAKHPTFREIAAHVRSALDECFPPESGVEIIGEPGRFFVKSTHTLAVSVVGKKSTVDEGSTDAYGRPLEGKEGGTGGTRYNYYVNEGLYGSFNCIMYDHVTTAPHHMMRSREGAVVAELDLKKLSDLHARRDSMADDAVAVLSADGTPLASDAVGLAAAAQLAQSAAAEASAKLDYQQHEAEARQEHVKLRYMHMGGHGAESDGLATLSAGSGALGGGNSGIAIAALGAAAAAASTCSARVSHARNFRTSANPATLPDVHPTTIWGPTCDSIDKISDDVPLPELHHGDWLVYENMGAYTIAGSCKFNGFPLTTKVYLHTDGSVEVQGEAEQD